MFFFWLWWQSVGSATKTVLASVTITPIPTSLRRRVKTRKRWRSASRPCLCPRSQKVSVCSLLSDLTVCCIQSRTKHRSSQNFNLQLQRKVQMGLHCLIITVTSAWVTPKPTTRLANRKSWCPAPTAGAQVRCPPLSQTERLQIFVALKKKKPFCMQATHPACSSLP